MIGGIIGLAICVVVMIPGFSLISTGYVLPGLLVILSPTICVAIIEIYSRIRRPREARLRAGVSPPTQQLLPAAVRAELEQTPAWWDQQYQALERQQISRAAEDHKGHDILEHRTYASTTIHRSCATCSIDIDPYKEQS